MVFPRELRFSRFFPWELLRELRKPLSLIEISLNYFPPDNQPLSVESAPGRGRSDHGDALLLNEGSEPDDPVDVGTPGSLILGGLMTPDANALVRMTGLQNRIIRINTKVVAGFL